MPKGNVPSLSIAAWNLNGLSGKAGKKYEDAIFCDEIQKHDLICLLETHMGPETLVKIDGYKSVPRYRKKCKANNRYYGGMLLCIKESIRKGVKIANNKDSETIWVQLCKDYFNVQDDIFIGFMYDSYVI